MDAILSDLQRIRRTGRLLLVAQRGALILAATIGAIAVLMVLDWLLRFPAPLRLVLLLAGLAGLGSACWTYLAPAIRFAPDLTSLALRAERAVPALRGRLASSVEFATEGLDRTNALAARVVAETRRRAAGALGGLMERRRTVRATLVLAAVLAATGAAVAASPPLASIGLVRLFAPFADASWPARTGVRSLMEGTIVRPRGVALPLRAQVTLGDPATTRVTATFRTIVGESAGPWRTVVLAYQGAAGDTGGHVHERLVDTDADAIEFSFATAESETPAQRIELVHPPSVRQAALRATPPAYAGAAGERSEILGTGTDGRAAAATPLLEGSDVRLELELTKPVPAPTDETERAAWIGRTVRGMDPPPALTIDPDAPTRWTLAWRMDKPVDIALTLLDEHGIANLDDIGFRIGATVDRDPTAGIVEPQTDELVAPAAIVRVVAEGRDDLGVSDLSVEVVRRRGDGQTADAAQTIRRDGAAPTGEGAGRDAPPTARLETALALASIEASPGDVVTLQAVVTDTFELDGRRHTPARSAVRTLRVVSETDLAEQLRRQLAALRQSAIRIDQQEAELMAAQDAALARGEALAGAGRRQGLVGERVAAQDEALDALAGRLERNRVDDPELASTVELARELLRGAGQASNVAAAALQRVEDSTTGGGAARPQGGARPEGGASATPGGDQAPPRDRSADEAASREAQERVRDELAGLIELLNRDQDAWSLTRKVEKLAEQVGALRNDTRTLDDRTVGRQRGELNADELTELERIAAAQRDAADQARELTDQLRDRADRPSDPSAGQQGVLRQAVQTAESRQLDDQLDQAARDVGGNRLQQAQQGQLAAQQTLRQMLQDLREGRRARTRELHRQLASLVESIERLVNIQTEEANLLALLGDVAEPAAAELADEADLRARAMIRLKQNTDAVVDEARRAGAETERIARILGRGADAQGEAIGHLRAEPLRLADAATAAEAALKELQEALELARKAQQRAADEEAERQRVELLERYRDAREKQIGVLEQTIAVGRDPNPGRRALLEAKRLGGVQQQVREQIKAIRDGSDVVRDSKVFTRAHELVDGWCKAAEAVLGEGDAGPKATAPQARITEALATIVAALESTPDEEPPFEDGNQPGDQEGGGGDQQPPPVIPPRSELKLLRGLQAQLYHQTRALDESGLAGDARRDAVLELGRRQRELADLAQQLLHDLGGGEQGGEDPAAPADRRPPRGAGAAIPHGDVRPDARPRPSESPMTAPTVVLRASMAWPLDEAREAPPPSSAPAARPADGGGRPAEKPKSLDELLGTAGAGRSDAKPVDPQAGAADKPADPVDAQRQEQLKRALTGTEAAEAFLAAVGEMSRSARQLEEANDTGLDTQRMQEDVLGKLDLLLKQPPKKGKGRASSGARSPQQDGRQSSAPPNQRSSGADGRKDRSSQPAADSSPDAPAPPNQQAALEQALESAGAEWGNLPPRLRDMIRQGLREPASGLYQRLTEEYYKRLAEEASK